MFRSPGGKKIFHNLMSGSESEFEDAATKLAGSLMSKMDGRSSAFAASDAPDDLVVLDVSTGDVVHRIEHPTTIDAVLVDHGSENIYTLDLAGSLRRFDVETGGRAWEVLAHPEESALDLPPPRDDAVHIISGDNFEFASLPFPSPRDRNCSSCLGMGKR